MDLNKIFHIINSSDLAFNKTTINQLFKGYDLVEINDQFNIDDLINNLDQDMLFNQPSIWLFNNSNHFSSNEQFKKTYQLLTKLLTAKQVCIFIVTSLAKSKDVLNFIDQYANVYTSFEYNQKTAFNYVLKLCADLQINLSDYQINSLINATAYDINLLHNEIHKISLLNQQTISNEVFDLIVSDYSNELVFKIIEHLYHQQIKQALKIVDYLLSVQTNEITIINAIATMMCKHYYVKKLTELDYDQDQIATSLEIKPFVVSIQQKMLVNFSSDWIIDKIKMLFNFDYLIKTNQIDKNHALFLWILSFYHI
ncbi:DNA polymerase III subunit delta [Ureaplasma diversum]|uniref:DNA-directed DNA polymerase n=1 Tax=Ureaplasma diversum NCTC 246 TaxID=1188241 RepID=A0A084EXQ4_9BACT|nr:hypothetical protein [Ureaplasma diversum]KEZ22746.1 DNA polymerase III, delta subunit [Ureaplasma diversum NCTC 246]